MPKFVKATVIVEMPGLNPGPFTCKANALPLRYIPYQETYCTRFEDDCWEGLFPPNRAQGALVGSPFSAGIPKKDLNWGIFSKASPCHDSLDSCRDQDSNLGCFGHNEEY